MTDMRPLPVTRPRLFGGLARSLISSKMEAGLRGLALQPCLSGERAG